MSSIQVQSAEVNNLARSTHLITGESEIGESQQQQCFQPPIYYDSNTIEQREGLHRSLAQNPNMLNDFYQYLEFTRARSAQQSFQHTYNDQINQEQQQIPSILNITTSPQHKSSTPKLGWANKRLKLGVNNKGDYMTLVTTENWPTAIKGVPIKILKPKFIPDCFALVAR
ncbi:unnamed protein product, partial [Rotaria sp. Silwood1]